MAVGTLCRCSKAVLANARIVGILIAGIAAASLAAAYIAQYIFGLQPCELCLIQRLPYALCVLWGILAFVAGSKGRNKVAAALVALAGLTFAAGAVVAFYHHGVEQHWWVSFLEGCKVNFGGGDLLSQIEGTKAVRCDEIPWQDPVFGQSMAAWNALLSTLYALGSFASAVLIARKANGFQ